MNAQEHNKLKKNWDDLLEQHSRDIIVSLYSDNVITVKDKKKVEKEKTESDKMEKLLSILIHKPPETKAFCKLLEALNSHPGTSWLAEQIRSTHSSSDVALKSEVDPHLLDSPVRAVLHKFFINKKGAVTQLTEIREVLQKEYVFKGKNEWNNKRLSDFLKEEYVEIKIEEVKKRTGKTAQKEILIKNLEKVPTQISEEDREDAVMVETTPLEEQVSSFDLEEMSCTQLKDYLCKKFEEKRHCTEMLSTLETQDISGSIFVSMTEEDFKDVFPSSTFGIRRFLSQLIKENKKSTPVKPYTDYLRNFDAEVDHTHKYIQGRCVDASVNAQGRMTYPLRNFHLIIDQNEEEALDFIGSEVIPFISACLNELRNGTIYFGISPSSEKYKCGEIVGVDVNKENTQQRIKDFIEQSFLKSQQNLIKNTVRDAKFIPVVCDASKQKNLDLFVVEIDVNPSIHIMKSNTVRTKLHCLPMFAQKYGKRDPVVFKFSIDGIPTIISYDDFSSHERDQERIVQQRQVEEAQTNSPSMPNLRKKLLDILTGGTEVIQDTIFPFLLISPIDTHMKGDYLSKNVTFIKDIKPEVVYDFDPIGSNSGIYHNLESVQGEVLRVLTTDNFDQSNKKKEEYKHFTECLSAEIRIPWVFCNGYEVMQQEPMEPTEWNRQRTNDFQESLRIFKNNFDQYRIIVIICLFSKNYEVLIEACEDVLKKFPDNWMVLAESDSIAKLWQDQMLARKKATKKQVSEKCVIGMPWDQVSATIKQAFNNSDLQNVCLLPTSTGALIEIRDKKLKDWSDLEVLSAGQFFIDENELKEAKKKEVEERFYRGDQVSWLNFHFHDQVLKRDIHENLVTTVNSALEGKDKEEEDKVTYVSLLHQPGAGGTTTAKQVLWDMRKDYRCCVVNTITDQTCDQLDELRMYGDQYPKPILVLIDNEDEDKCLQLRGSLEERGRLNSKYAEKSFNVYCTIILCVRRASLPTSLSSSIKALRQELTSKELEWFKVKNENLETRFKKDMEGNVNPKFLISFNILKENFNKEYISKVVREFTDDIKHPREVNLLKIISLLNTYDLDFKPIPVSCLDSILEQGQNYKSKDVLLSGKRIPMWEANLSQGIKVLLNLASNKNQPGRARTSLRVFNKNIAQEILSRMKERTEQRESQIMSELMESGTFEQESADSKKLRLVINNIFKKRELNPDGIKKEKFSNFVIYVKNSEGAEVAVRLLEQLFSLNQDPFTAQLVARFYIDIKNWTRAESYARKATSMQPSCSFLWDTLGQVYKNQLFDQVKVLPGGLQESEITDIIKLSEKCIEVFRKEQDVSEHEITTNGDNNFAGHFGELRAILLLLNAFNKCRAFCSEDKLHKYLVDEGYKPDSLKFLTDHEESFIKNLGKNSKKAMRRLDEEYLQMKSSLNLRELTGKSEYDKKSLFFLKVNLDEYLGEKSDSVPQNLNEPDSCEYIRRRVNKLGGSSLYSLLKLRKSKEYDKVERIYKFVQRNISSQACTHEDLQIFLNTVTVMLIDNHVPQGLNYDQILHWCRNLYMMSQPDTDRYHLEIFLYFVMYNFPTENRKPFNLCMISDLENGINKMYSAFKKNYPKSANEAIKLKRRETTLFFLGKGQPLHDIVHQDSLSEMEHYSLTQKWNVPEVRKKLQMMTGTLCDKGEKIKLLVTTKEGNQFSFSIQTSHKVTKKDMWQKKVFFYVGFSFSGPLAYGMSTEELGKQTEPPQVTKPPTQILTKLFYSKQQETPILSHLLEIMSKLEEDEKRLKNEDKSNILERKKKIKSKIMALLGEQTDD